MCLKRVEFCAFKSLFQPLRLIVWLGDTSNFLTMRMANSVEKALQPLDLTGSFFSRRRTLATVKAIVLVLHRYQMNYNCSAKGSQTASSSGYGSLGF